MTSIVVKHYITENKLRSLETSQKKKNRTWICRNFILYQENDVLFNVLTQEIARRFVRLNIKSLMILYLNKGIQKLWLYMADTVSYA